MLFYVAFNSQSHIATGSLQVEETSVNHWASESNYQLSNMKRPAQDSNRRSQRLEARTLTTTPPSPQPIDDIVQYCEDFNKHGTIICLDFKKAFNSLDWNFLFRCLKAYNFGKNFLRWIRILYNEPTFSVKNNGWISKEGHMNSGIKQGCAVSALLFILAVEFMALEIKNKDTIKGKQLFTKSTCIVQYADDTTLTLLDHQSITEALKIVKIVLG